MGFPKEIDIAEVEPFLMVGEDNVEQPQQPKPRPKPGRVPDHKRVYGVEKRGRRRIIPVERVRREARELIYEFLENRRLNMQDRPVSAEDVELCVKVLSALKGAKDEKTPSQKAAEERVKRDAREQGDPEFRKYADDRVERFSDNDISVLLDAQHED